MPNPRRPMRGAIALAVLGLMVAPAGIARAAYPGANGRIAFDDYATGQIYTVNPDGTGLVQLTDVKPGRFAGDPSWSPDGTQIVFEKSASDRTLLWIMDADGSNEHRVAEDRKGAFSFAPTFTPDGSRIVYFRCWQYTDPTGGRPFTCRIFSISVDGTDRVGLTTTRPTVEVFDFDPSVSPDGSQIAFARHNQNYDGIKGQVYLMGIDGTDQHAVTAPELEAWYPDWSPDGTRIAFTSACCRPGSEGYVMNADGSNVRRLTQVSFPHNDVQFTYSPDGTRMLFASDRAYDDLCCSDMFVMNGDGTQQTMVQLGLSQPHDFSWGPAVPMPAGSPAVVGSMSPIEISSRVVARCSVVPRALRSVWCA